jgi:peptidoglycan/LPS O-acetylase OafA/YrhL
VIKTLFSSLIPPSGGTRFPALDGLRGLAVLAVMLNHMPIIGGTKYIIGTYGWHAVCIFFTLSAFLLYYPLTKPQVKISFGSYYLRRFLRIYPAWLFATIFSILIFFFCFGSISILRPFLRQKSGDN